jgi:hypothetical protein
MVVDMEGTMHHLGAEGPVLVCCSLARLFMQSLQVRGSRPSSLIVKRTHDLSDGTEILVDVVDVILDGSGIPEKFLGITLFALVPNTTEFMNAMAFALNGNIALRWVHSR